MEGPSTANGTCGILSHGWTVSTWDERLIPIRSKGVGIYAAGFRPFSLLSDINACFVVPSLAKVSNVNLTHTTYALLPILPSMPKQAQVMSRTLR